MTEADANAVLEPGETLRHFASGKAAPLQARLSTDAVVVLFTATLLVALSGFAFIKTAPWLTVLLVSLYFPAIYAIFFRSGSAKTCYAVTDRRVLILHPKRPAREIAQIAEVETNTSGVVQVCDGQGKLHRLTPIDDSSLERAILELASPTRTAVVTSPDNLGMESQLLDGEQVLWSGKVKAWHLLSVRLRLLGVVILVASSMQQILGGGLRSSQLFLMLTVTIGQVFVILPNEGYYIITNRRAWWVCGARRRSMPLTVAPEVWLRENGVGTMLFPGKRRWQGVPEAENAAEAIRQALAAPAPQTANTVSVEEPAAWWLSARR